MRPPHSSRSDRRVERASTDVLELRERMRDRPLALTAAWANAQRARDVDDVGLLDYALQELGASTLLALENLRAPRGAGGLIDP